MAKGDRTASKGRTSKTYVREVYVNPPDSHDVPVEAHIPVRREDLARIFELAEFAKAKELYCTQQFDYRADWGKDEHGVEHRVECCCLEITSDTLCMRGIVRGSDIEVKTEDVELSEIARDFSVALPLSLQPKAA